MRWDELFSDLEAQAGAAEQAELAGEVADRSRLEQARLGLADRLRAARGRVLALTVRSAGPIEGELLDTGADWLRLASAGTTILVPLAAVTAVRGLPFVSETPDGAGVVAARLDLRYVLRGLARDRTPAYVHLAGGLRLHGTFDRIGADFAEVAEHPPDEPRRADRVRSVVSVPIGALCLIVVA